MRLINAATETLEEVHPGQTPPYAILSHTWGDEEISYQELVNNTARAKESWRKIEMTCRLAIQHKLQYAWVDTCCIDKSSSAELSEAINSMFEWYQRADICYVYLADLAPGASLSDGLPSCRWWTRGWTLQELLAPKLVTFYNRNWELIGTKQDLANTIASRTRIPEEAIRYGFGGNMPELSSYSVAAKMSWASQRQTGRIEDEAYCLFGLFDVNMPLVYGEGRKAFRRLQEEIIKKTNDLTILASSPLFGDRTTDLFAPSPSHFFAQNNLCRFSYTLVDFNVTNRGLKFGGHLPLRFCAVRPDGWMPEVPCMLLLLGYNSGGDKSKATCLPLRKLGRRLFVKDTRFPLLTLNSDGVRHIKFTQVTDPYVLIETKWSFASYDLVYEDYAKEAIQVTTQPDFKLDNVVPEGVWDFEHRIFLKPRPDSYIRFEMVLCVSFVVVSLGVQLIVLCDYRSKPPKAKISTHLGNPTLVALLFQDRYREDSISWADLETYVPSVKDLTDRTEVSTDERSLIFNVSFEEIRSPAPRFKLSLDVSAASGEKTLFLHGAWRTIQSLSGFEELE